MVIVLADPLRGPGLVVGFEKDGRLIVQFEEDDQTGAEWDPPAQTGSFHPQELELASVWEQTARGTFTDDVIAGIFDPEETKGG